MLPSFRAARRSFVSRLTAGAVDLWTGHFHHRSRARVSRRPLRAPATLRWAIVERLEARALLTTILNVDTFNDVVNAGDGVTSLREAIIHANSNPDDFEIRLQTGTYWLTIGGANESAAATGDLDVLDNGSITIAGAGAVDTVINAGGDGGMIPALGDRVFHVFRDASLTVEGVNITGGIAGGFSGAGGGIRNDDGGMLTVIDSTLSGNSATSLGGGLLNDGRLTVTGSTFSGNSANFGGGIYARGIVTVAGSTFSGNSAGALGGGIAVVDRVTVTDSTLSGNSADEGGGIWNNNGDLTVTGSTLSGNSAGGDSNAGRGGGIQNSGSLSVVNSTLSGNSAERDGGGIFNTRSLSVRNSTLVGNRADADGANGGTGGGISTGGISAFTGLVNTIVAGNFAGAETAETANELGGGNVTSSSAFNLIGDDGSAGGLADGANGNIVGVDAATVLGSTLAENGGPTLTHALVAGSPAIDAGDPDFDLGAFDPLLYDQRGEGFDRVANGRIDIGAVEVAVPDPAPVGGVIVVTRFEDVTSPNDGVWSLREAVIEANSTAGDLEIRLQAGAYFLTIAGADEDAAATGDLDVLNNGSITIVGDGAEQTIIDADGDGGSIPALGDRVFHVLTDATLNIEGVTITGGTVTGTISTLSADDGGGIWNSNGDLTVKNSTLSGNSADQGGGIWNTGTLTVTDSTLSDNSGRVGGGIASFGTLTVTNSTLSGNSAQSSGGGIANSGGAATVTNSTLSGNSARGGGGISNSGTLTVTNSTLSGNSAFENSAFFDSSGGGIRNDSLSTATVTNSTLSGNSASDGGGIANFGRLTVTGSTLSGNSSASNNNTGGGIYNFDELTVENSTLSGNLADGDGGGISSFGSLRVTNSTLVGNRADANGDDGGTGGGIWTHDDLIFQTSTTTLFNTIVAGNFAGSGTDPSDLARKNVETNSSFNLIGNAGSSGGLTDGTNGNIVGVDAATVLDTTLANNGGPTLTHALVGGGPAVNAGDPNFDPAAFDPPLAHDQRGEGFNRVADGRIDIGAVELPASEPAGPQVTGRVWLDADANGLLDSGEAGMANVAVRLRDASSGELLDETVTDDQGDYVLEAGDAEEVFVEFVAPERHIYTRQAELGSDEPGSHAARGSGVSATGIFTIGGGFGGSSSPIRAGLVPLRESAPWQNPVEAEDVDNNGSLSIQDLLALVTQLREQGLGDLEDEPETLHEFVDVNGDNQRTISDLLAVVTALRNSLSGGGFGGEGEAEFNGASDPVDTIAAASAGFWPVPDARDRALRGWSEIDRG